MGLFGFGSKKDKKPQDKNQPPPVPAPSPAKNAVNAQQAGAAIAGAALAPKVETKEERNAFLGTERDKVLPGLVKSASDSVVAALTTKMGKVIESQKKTILANAAANVENTVKGKPGAPDIKGADVVKDGAAWDEAAKSAGTQASAMMTQQKKDDLKHVGEPEFVVGDDFDPSLTKDKQLVKVTASAKKKIDGAAKLLENELVADIKVPQNSSNIVSKAQMAANTQAAKEGEDEQKDRAAHEVLITNIVREPVGKFSEEIKAEEKEYLENGLGANGVRFWGWFRSKEFNKFNAKMKAAAKEKAQVETDKALVEERGKGVDPKKKAEFEHQAMKAHIMANDAAGGELSIVLKELAADLLTNADNQVHIGDLLKATASAAAWSTLRDDDKDHDKARKTVTSALKGAKDGVQKQLHDKATLLKNEYIKASGDTPAEQAQSQVNVDNKQNDLISNKLDKQFEKKDDKDGDKTFGQKMVARSMEAPTAGKGLEMVAKLIDAAAPQVGNETEIQVELKIPATHGAFVYFTVTGNAARTKHMEVGVDIAFGAGWETWGFSVKGGFNVFLKAGAHDTVTAMQLIHYGAFRNLTGVSDKAANFWAGTVDPSKTGKDADHQISKTEQAELWAAMMEEKAFAKDKGAFVEVGGGGGVGAKLNVGVAKGEASMKLQTAKRWDKEVIDKAGPMESRVDPVTKEDKSAQERDRIAQAKRDAVKKHAKRINTLKFGTQVEAEANGQKFTLGIEGERVGVPKPPPEKSGANWKITATGGIPYNGNDASATTMLSKIAGSYVPAGLAGIKKIYDLYKAKHPTQAPEDDSQEGEGDGGAQVTGGVADVAEDLLVGLDAGGMTNDLMKQLAEANPQNLSTAGTDAGVNDTMRTFFGGKAGASEVPKAQPFGMTSQLQIALVVEIPDKGAPRFTFKVMRSKELAMGGELGGGVGLTAKITRKEELGGVSYQGGKAQGGNPAGEGLQVFGGGRQTQLE